jgi:hypothetical protein
MALAATYRYIKGPTRRGAAGSRFSTPALSPVIILMIFFWMLNILLLFDEFPQMKTPYDMMEWK